MSDYKLNLEVTGDKEILVRCVLSTDSLAALVLAGTTSLETLLKPAKRSDDDEAE